MYIYFLFLLCCEVLAHIYHDNIYIITLGASRLRTIHLPLHVRLYTYLFLAQPPPLSPARGDIEACRCGNEFF
jgi:hypothetical protein